MMNMMDRFVEGRGHQREIDMLLELTCVPSPSSDLPSLTSRVIENKSRAEPSVHWATPLLGPFKVSCATSVSFNELSYAPEANETHRSRSGEADS